MSSNAPQVEQGNPTPKNPEQPSDSDTPNDFERQAEQADIGFLAEFVMFLRDNKKWWLIPLIGSLLLIGLISLLAASGAAPFIYTVF